MNEIDYRFQICGNDGFEYESKLTTTSFDSAVAAIKRLMDRFGKQTTEKLRIAEITEV